MVLPLDSLCFALAHAQIQTLWLVGARLRPSHASARLRRSRRHRRPLAVRDIHKFAQKDLILAADDNILFRLLELGSLLLLLLELPQIGFHFAGLLRLDNFRCVRADGLANLGNLVELGLVDFLVALA